MTIHKTTTLTTLRPDENVSDNFLRHFAKDNPNHIFGEYTAEECAMLGANLSDAMGELLAYRLADRARAA